MFLLALEIACDQTGSQADAKSIKCQKAYARRNLSSKKQENPMVFLTFAGPSGHEGSLTNRKDLGRTSFFSERRAPPDCIPLAPRCVTI